MMNRLICVIGNKGGTGKTSITHMLCHGLGLLGKRSIAVMTDTFREPVSREGRLYTPLDGRSPEKLEKIIAKLESMPDWYGVIDGVANHPKWTNAYTKYPPWCYCRFAIRMKISAPYATTLMSIRQLSDYPRNGQPTHGSKWRQNAPWTS